MNNMNRIDWKLYYLLKQHDIKAAKKYKSEMKIKRNLSAAPHDAWKIVFYTEYGFTKKRFFPFFFTDEEWSEFVECEELPPITSMYDCTGLPFTFSIDRYTTKHGTWVYHTIDYDI